MAFTALLPISGATARSLLLLIGIAAAELAVVVGFGDVEIDIAISAVGRAFGFQFANQRLDAIDAAGGPRHAIGRKDVQPAHIDFKGFDVAFAHRLHRAAFFIGPVENLVVDVGVVLDVGDVVAAPDQITAQHIPVDVAAGMAKVAEVIDRDTAAVNRCFAGFEGLERFRTARQAVGEAQGHGRSVEQAEVTACMRSGSAALSLQASPSLIRQRCLGCLRGDECLKGFRWLLRIVWVPSDRGQISTYFCFAFYESSGPS